MGTHANVTVKKLTRLFYGLSGMSYIEVGKRLGIPSQTVNRWGAKNNWPAWRREFQEIRQGGAKTPEELQVVAQAEELRGEDRKVARVLKAVKDVQGEVWGEDPRVAKVEEAIESFVQESQAANDRHWELYEAFHELIRNRLGIQGSTMADPGTDALPNRDLPDLLKCVKMIQEGQRKAMGIDDENKEAGDIFIEYVNLSHRLGKGEGDGPEEERARALEYAGKILRDYGVAIPAEITARTRVIDAETGENETPNELPDHVKEALMRSPKVTSADGDSSDAIDAIDAATTPMSDPSHQGKNGKNGIKPSQADILSGLTPKKGPNDAS